MNLSTTVQQMFAPARQPGQHRRHGAQQGGLGSVRLGALLHHRQRGHLDGNQPAAPHAAHRGDHDAHAERLTMLLRTGGVAHLRVGSEQLARFEQRQASGLRLTLGRWVVGPNSINTIPGEVEFTIDMRCVDESVLAGFDAVMREVLQACAGRTRQGHKVHFGVHEQVHGEVLLPVAGG